MGLRRGKLLESGSREPLAVPQTIPRQIAALASVCVAVFVCVVPWSAWRLGSTGVAAAVVAAGCCLLPGCLLFLLQLRFGRGSLIVPLLIGVASRVGCCLLGMGWLHLWFQVPLEPLALVFLAFYLAGLACETWVLSAPLGKRWGGK